MKDAKRSLKEAGLYLVLDRQVCAYDRLEEVMREAVGAGVGIVQLRDKTGTAREIMEFCRRAVKFLQGKVPFIVNDRIDIASAVGADGVHLGQEDVPIADARRILPKAVIGVSCQTLSQAKCAQRDGADYIGFGSVFRTPTKPSRQPMDPALLQSIYREITIPVFAIGGIGLEHLPDLVSRGVKRVAVTRAISLSPNIGETTRQFIKILNPDFALAPLLRGQSKIRPKGRMVRLRRDMRG